MDSTQHTNNRPLVNLTFLNITRDSVTMQPSLHQVSDIDDDTMLHKTAVLVIMSILIFISASLSGAVLVFCKKKNSVFIYQKSEPVEKDYEYEMDDIQTEIDSSEIDNEPIRSQTYPMIAAINSSPIKTRYKFIPKSKTFSGTDNHSLFHLGKQSSQNTNSWGFSDSFCTSSSPSLNFQSLTIKADVETCLESQSLECLNDISKCNDHSNTCKSQHEECFKSPSAERLLDSIPWDNDLNLNNLMSLPQISNLTNDLTSCKYSKSFDSTSTSKYVISNCYDTKLQIELEYSSNEGSSAIKTWTPTNGSSVDSDHSYDTKHTTESECSSNLTAKNERSLKQTWTPMNGSPVNSEEAINRPLLSDTDIV